MAEVRPAGRGRTTKRTGSPLAHERAMRPAVMATRLTGPAAQPTLVQLSPTWDVTDCPGAITGHRSGPQGLNGVILTAGVGTAMSSQAVGRLDVLA